MPRLVGSSAPAGLLVMVLLGFTPAVASGAPAPAPKPDEDLAERPDVVDPQSHLLSANPDTPGVTFMWRGQLRGTLAARVPLVGRPQRPGLMMAIVPLIELYNQQGSGEVLPNEGWRGQLGLSAGWLWGERPTERRYLLGGYVRHESDHATAGTDAPSEALQFNEVTLLGAVQLPQPRLMVRVEVRARALFSSCTDIQSTCRGIKGDGSFGSEVDLILDLGGAEPIRKHWYFFSSVHGAGVVPNGQVIRELRTTLHVGVYVPVKFGVWELFGLGFFGNDIGIYRGDTVYQGGAGARWTF